MPLNKEKKRGIFHLKPLFLQLFINLSFSVAGAYFYPILHSMKHHTLLALVCRVGDASPEKEVSGLAECPYRTQTHPPD